MKITLKKVLIIASLLGLFFTNWGLWDLGYWINAYPNRNFEMPFNLVNMPWWIAGDLFVVISAIFALILTFIAFESERYKNSQADKDRELIRENIAYFKEMIAKMEKISHTRQRKPKGEEK